MKRCTAQTRIAAAPDKVHDFIGDFGRYPEWIPFTKEVTAVEGDGGPGTRYWEKGTGGKSSWEVIEVERGRREVHEGDIGIARMRIIMEMAPVGKGKKQETDYVQAIEYDMKVPVLGAIIDKLAFRRSLRNGLDETVANLKRLVEAEA